MVVPARTKPLSNFVCCAAAVDARAILAEVDARPDLWLRDTSRQRNVRCQRHTQSIFLRAAAKPLPPGAKNANDVQECRTLRTAGHLPRTLAFCHETAVRAGGTLGRTMLVALLPGSRVYPHVDHGEYYRVRDRYHLVLKSRSGSRLTAGDETAVLREGELWVFNNKIRHAAWNDSGESRVHLIFDVLPPAGGGYFADPGRPPPEAVVSGDVSTVAADEPAPQATVYGGIRTGFHALAFGRDRRRRVAHGGAR